MYIYTHICIYSYVYINPFIDVTDYPYIFSSVQTFHKNAVSSRTGCKGQPDASCLWLGICPLLSRIPLVGGNGTKTARL